MLLSVCMEAAHYELLSSRCVLGTGVSVWAAATTASALPTRLPVVPSVCSTDFALSAASSCDAAGRATQLTATCLPARRILCSGGGMR